MTDLASTGAQTRTDTFEPSGHPVRRAVIGLVVLTALIVAVWWAGLASPRIDMVGHNGSYDELTHEGSANVTVVNDGPLAIEIVGVEAPTEFHDFRLPEQVRIDAGEQAEVLVEGTIDCAAPIEFDRVPFDLVVRTAVGIERRMSDADGGAAIYVFNCPRPA